MHIDGTHPLQTLMLRVPPQRRHLHVLAVADVHAAHDFVDGLVAAVALDGLLFLHPCKVICADVEDRVLQYAAQHVPSYPFEKLAELERLLEAASTITRHQSCFILRAVVAGLQRCGLNTSGQFTTEKRSLHLTAPQAFDVNLHPLSIESGIMTPLQEEMP